MSKVYVYSTASCDNSYAIYEPLKNGDSIHKVKKVNGKPLKMLIKGGSNVADKNLVTPYGVVTEVESDLFEALEQNSAFQRHIKNGYIAVSKTRKEKEKVVAKDMEKKDKSAPKTDDDFKQKAETGKAE